MSKDHQKLQTFLRADMSVCVHIDGAAFSRNWSVRDSLLPGWAASWEYYLNRNKKLFHHQTMRGRLLLNGTGSGRTVPNMCEEWQEVGSPGHTTGWGCSGVKMMMKHVVCYSNTNLFIWYIMSACWWRGNNRVWGFLAVRQKLKN